MPSPILRRLFYGEQTVTAPSLLLDLFPNAAAAYSVSRQLDPDQVAAMDVRESGGDTEATINYSGGVLDEAALLSHCGANDGFVVKLYDHSGNDFDQTQATAAQQPKIVDAGTVIKLNGKPAIEFDATDDYMNVAASVDISTNGAAVFYVGDRRSVDSFAAYWDIRSAVNLTEEQLRIETDGGENNHHYIYREGETAINLKGESPTIDTQFIHTTVHTADVAQLYKNGVLDVEDTDTSLPANDATAFGLRPANLTGVSTVWLKRRVNEWLFYNDGSVDRAGIESNINDHYSIF